MQNKFHLYILINGLRIVQQNKFIIVQVYLEYEVDEGMSRMQRNRFKKAQEIFRGQTEII